MNRPFYPPSHFAVGLVDTYVPLPQKVTIPVTSRPLDSVPVAEDTFQMSTFEDVADDNGSAPLPVECAGRSKRIADTEPCSRPS